MNQARFDNLKLVHDQRVLSGTMPVAGFPRLMESLQQGAGSLAYRVEGTMDRRQRPLLKLQVSGTVQLQCQRCLEGLDYKVAIDTALRLVAEAALAAEHDDDPAEPDCVAASAECDLAQLIEDEVLLALPAYPRHEAGSCKGVSGMAADGTGIQAFSALQALKQKLTQSKE